MIRSLTVLPLLLLALGCREETAMLIFVDTDIPSIDRVRVLVDSSDGTSDFRDTEGGFQTVARPVRLTLVPEGTPGDFAVRVTGLDREDNPVLEQHAVTRFEDGEVLFLRMYLYASCLGVADMCSTDETCDDGLCVPAARSGTEYDTDPSGLVPTAIGDDGGADGGVDGGVDGGLACDPETCWEGCPRTGSGPCDPVVELAAGGAHTCARTEQGDLYCWGTNDVGQLGYDTRDAPSGPAPVFPGGEVVVDVSAGLDHTCAVVADERGDRAVWCWGDNADGQLGTAAVPGTFVPIQVQGLEGQTDIRGIAAGGQHSCALVGTVDPGVSTFCTGNNDSAQLGRPPVDGQSDVFTFVTTFVDAFGIVAGDQHTCFVYDGMRAVCWGESDAGRLGNNRSGREEANQVAVLVQEEPVIVATVAAISTGHSHTCIHNGAGEVRCFGKNDHGQLGSGAVGEDVLMATARPETSPGTTPSDWTAIATGFLQTCGVRNSEIWCWGWNNEGALGLVGGSNFQPPQRVQQGETPTDGEPTAIAIGGGPDPLDPTGTDNVTHACALVSGIVYCWGDNTSGQVDIDEASALVDAPRRVPGPP